MNHSENLSAFNGNTAPLARLQSSMIPKHVRFIIEKLHANDFQAFVVGGSIRDLLLHSQPKDFDVATSAEPQQIKAVFRRKARVIGRRFQIAHLFHAGDITEVTTFRSGPEDPRNKKQDASGQLISDNIFGKSMEEDAKRRDFTINALYYDPQKNKIYDPVNGLQDLKNRCLRVIGDPDLRYREDPVRMLRALRFVAKLDFHLESDDAAILCKLAPGITQARPARLALEMQKLFITPYGEQVCKLLEEYGLFAALFPRTATLLDTDPYARALVHAALKDAKKRIHKGRKQNMGFLYAAFLWPALLREISQNGSRWSLSQLQNTQRSLIQQQVERISIPVYMRSGIRTIWEMQFYLERRWGKNKKIKDVQRISGFRAGLALLKLRRQSGEEALQEICQWWEQKSSIGKEDTSAQNSQFKVRRASRYKS